MMQTAKTTILTCLLMTTFPPAARAEVVLPAIFGHNMILQQGRRVAVWGRCSEGEVVTVEFAGRSKEATPDQEGRWRVLIKPGKASADPRRLVVRGQNRIVLTNILVGEVWFCSGQSNMEKPIGEIPRQRPVPNYRRELAAADCPTIRLFKVKKEVSAVPLEDVEGSWWVCSSNALEATKFSAVAYFFAREIQRELGVPVGLVEAAWGGTRIEPWTPAEAFELVSGLAQLVQPQPSTEEVSSKTPSAIYRGMVAPVAGFGIRGFLWYQGEANCMRQPDGPIYADKMEALIRGWRGVWGYGKLPFYYVQLAPFRYFERREPFVSYAEALPEIWEAQTAALRVPNTGMVVITDLVDDLNDIHPTEKKEVGRRLARVALANCYERKDVVWSGPMFRKAVFRDGEAIVHFDHVDGGLLSRDGAPLTGFTIAGADGVPVPAEARIKGKTVIVSSPTVPKPKAVRFAWHESAQPNLINKAGLPAGPFRSDKP